MDFEWDERKNEECVQSRGFGFTYVAQAFLDPSRTIEIDNRHEYGECRYRLAGRIGDRIFIVIYTLRSERVRIISARKANLREVRKHEYGQSQVG
jgi:uncharacterized DUF497 family protein